MPIASEDLLAKLIYHFQAKIDEEFLNKLMSKFCYVYNMIKIQENISKRKSSDSDDTSKRFKITSVDGERIDAYLKTVIKTNSETSVKSEPTKQSKRQVELSSKVLNKNPTQFLERLLAQVKCLFCSFVFFVSYLFIFSRPL